MMQVENQQRAGWCVVVVAGRADAEAAEELEQALRAAVDEHPRVAVNFGSLTYISSAGLRAVLQGARAAESKGVEFLVCSPNHSVKKVLDMSGLHHVMKIQEALPC